VFSFFFEKEITRKETIVTELPLIQGPKGIQCKKILRGLIRCHWLYFKLGVRAHI